MKYIGIALVYVYRYTLGPFLGGRCKYHPSCSQYAIDALHEYGLVRGSTLAFWRLLRCNPWSHGGVDYAKSQSLFPEAFGVMILAGILTPIEAPLTAVLEWLHGSVGISWAWSIVVLTVMVRILLVPLTIKQVKSMQRLQEYAPQLKAIQQKYKGDKQRTNEEVMKFYRENKVNPAASCLPVVFQIPIFIGLYYVLRDFKTEILPNYPGSSLEFLNGLVPNITDNVNAHWSGYLLLVIYVGSQLLSTFLMSNTMDKTQRILFLVMPFAFVFFIIRFPVGLMIYWVTTNLWTTGQGIITRRMFPKTQVALPKKTSRTEPAAKPEPAAVPKTKGPAQTKAKSTKTSSSPAKAQDGTGAAQAPTSGQQPRPVRRRKKKGPRARR